MKEIPLTKGFVTLFDNREQAAVKYNEAAKMLYGEFARVNEV